jgi:hypothetical protein
MPVFKAMYLSVTFYTIITVTYKNTNSMCKVLNTLLPETL